MAPKYRGDDDDWLDSDKERGQHGSGPRAKKEKPKVGYLPIEEGNGTVAEVFPNQCKVIADPVLPADGKLAVVPVADEYVACTYRKARLPTTEVRERAPVAVGDRVRMERVSVRDGVIDGVCERRNVLARPAPERAMRHSLVANVDTLAIVAACRDPDFSPGLVDRFLVAALAQGIEPIICVTKMDLIRDDPDAERPWSLYEEIGFTVIETCAKSGEGLDALQSAIGGKLTTFCGHSGVGKTSLLNALVGRTVGKTAEISLSTGKGMHTTTGAYLIPGTRLIDTPGVRAFGLLGISPADLGKYFPEFRVASCAVEGCLHREEEGCGVTDFQRYPSYRRILESLMAGEN
jgi:ribosome biogenesis GTPase